MSAPTNWARIVGGVLVVALALACSDGDKSDHESEVVGGAGAVGGGPVEGSGGASTGGAPAATGGDTASSGGVGGAPVVGSGGVGTGGASEGTGGDPGNTGGVGGGLVGGTGGVSTGGATGGTAPGNGGDAGSSGGVSGGSGGVEPTGGTAGAPGGTGGTSPTGGSAGALTSGGSAGTGTAGSGGTAGQSGVGGAAGSTAGGSAGGSSLGAPTYETEFVNGDGWSTRSETGGSVEFGVSAGSDGNVAVLTFPGDPALGSEEQTSPAYASEMTWDTEVQFGTFRARVELARCDAGEEVVNGIFTYAHGGDANANGITDNDEIDIEILCGEPYIIFLTSWTDYDDDTSFRKWSRAIDTRTGEYRESTAAGEYGLGPVLGTIPGATVPGFPAAGTFYEMGFDWQPSRLRFFMLFDTEEVTLWDFTDASLIPQNPAQFLFNVWHAPTHWFEGGSADYPASDAVMRVDWFRYWAAS